MSNVNINYSIEEAETMIASLQEKIREAKDKESKSLVKKYKKEIDDKYIKNLCEKVSNILKKLNEPNYPKDGLCTHFGVGFAIKNDYVNISPRSFNDNRLLITIYRQSTYLPNGQRFGNTKIEHHRKMKALSDALNAVVLDEWNGEEGQDGISFILDMQCPKSLATACLNYHNLDSVFNLTKKQSEGFKKFDKWAGIKS